MLPRGKLRRGERSVTGARREVIEETGFRVRVGEFLGAIIYRVRGRPKVVQFWRMQAAAHPSHEVTKDIMAVEWLPFAAAVRRLGYPFERLFLEDCRPPCHPAPKARHAAQGPRACYQGKAGTAALSRKKTCETEVGVSDSDGTVPLQLFLTRAWAMASISLVANCGLALGARSQKNAPPLSHG